MNLQEHILTTLNRLKQVITNPVTELHYTNAYELLVAVILSAQCTDKRVNQTTPAFFEQFPDVYALNKASIDQVFPLIKSISYPNNKAKNLILAAQTLVQKHNGQIPDTLDELLQIPGVGRKTANVLLSVLFNKPAMAVDTHVLRVSNRLGWIQSSNPLLVEKILTDNIPTELIPQAHHLLILHGRYTCTAKKPKCSVCILHDLCPSANKN